MDKLERLMLYRFDYEIFNIILNPKISDIEASYEFTKYIKSKLKYKRKDGAYISVKVISKINGMDTLFKGDNEIGEYLFDVSKSWAHERILNIQFHINQSGIYKFGFNIDVFDMEDEVIDTLILKLYRKNKSIFRMWFEKVTRKICIWFRYLPITVYIHKHIMQYKYRHG